MIMKVASLAVRYFNGLNRNGSGHPNGTCLPWYYYDYENAHNCGTNCNAGIVSHSGYTQPIQRRRLLDRSSTLSDGHGITT